MKTEVVRPKLRQITDWMSEAFFGTRHRDIARRPGGIRQAALSEVGYEYSEVQSRGISWVSVSHAIQFNPQLVSLTFDRVNESLDRHRNKVDAKIWGENGRVFKSIVHYFCLFSTASNSPEWPQRYNDFLVGEVTALLKVPDSIRRSQVTHFGENEKIVETLDLMMKEGLLRRKPGRKMEHIYLTPLIDSLLA